MATDRSTILTAYAALEELHAKVASFVYTGLSVAELLELKCRREVLARCPIEGGGDDETDSPTD
jgi:hypothetical protein